MARINYSVGSNPRKIKTLALGVALTVVAGMTAFAFAVGGSAPSATFASPGTEGAHFMSSAASVNSDGALVVSFDEAGLGHGNIDYMVTADAVANYGCINGGGRHPRASNKETMVGEVTGEGSFQTRNGRVRASITLDPLSSGSFACPNGQTLVLADVSYSNVTITDTTNNVVEMVAGVFTRTFYTFR